MSVRNVIALGAGVAGGLLFGPVGASAGFLIGGAIGGLLFPEKQAGSNTTLEGPRLNDLHVQTSTYGKGIPIVFGGVRVAGNVIWAIDIEEVRVEETTSTGGGQAGKGVGGAGAGGGATQTQTQVTYEYYGTAAIAFAAGPIQRFRKVWADGKLIVDETSGNFDEAENGNSIPGKVFKYPEEHFRFYLGTEDQDPDHVIEADKGAGNVPGYRGTAYMVIDRLPLKDFANRIPNFSAEVVKVATIDPVDQNMGITANMQKDGMRLSQKDHTAFLLRNRVVTRVNRLTGEQIYSIDIQDTGFGTQVGTGWSTLHPQVFLDPTNNDVYVGIQQTSTGGVAVFDEFMNFKHYQHYGFIGDAAKGHVVRLGTEGNRLAIFDNAFNGVVRTALVGENPDGSYFYTPRGFIDPTTGEVRDFAFSADRQKGWILIYDDFTDDGGTIYTISAEGNFFGPTKVSALPADSTPWSIHYDKVTEALFVFCTHADGDTTDRVYKLDPDDFSLIQVVTHDFSTADNTGWRNHQTEVDGEIWHSDANEFVIFDTRTMADKIRYDVLTILNLVSINIDGLTFDPLTQCWWVNNVGLRRICLNRFTNDGQSLGAIVQDLCERTGLVGATDLDVSELTDIVKGFVIQDPLSAREAILPLQNAYVFDGALIDWKIKFPKRGSASVITIPENDVVRSVGDSDRDNRIVEPRQQEVEVPRRVSVSYLNRDNDYQVATQHDQRIQTVTGAVGEANVRLPLVFSDQEARNVASIYLRSAWTERKSLEFMLPPKYLTLDPTDVMVIQKTEGMLTTNFEVRILDVELGDGYTLECKTVFTNTAVFQPNVTAAPVEGKPAGAIPYDVSTKFLPWNGPAFSLLQDTGGAYWGAAPGFNVPNANWSGGALFRSDTATGTFDAIGANLDKTLWFKATAVPGDHENYTVFDTTNTITVVFQVPDVVLQTRTDLEVLNGANRIALGQEVIQFATATLLSTNTWQLSRLLRGRQGTESFISGHTAGEVGFVLELNKLGRISDLTERNVVFWYKALTIGGGLGQPPAESFTNLSTAKLPWAPTDIQQTPDGPDIDLTWKRRTRYGGEWLDEVNVALNEASEAYEVDIMAGTVVKRTLTGITSEAVTYQQLGTDFAYPYSATITNSGAEDGDLTGWTEIDGNWAAVTSQELVTPRTGTYFFRCNGAGDNDLQQDITGAPNVNWNDIDAGTVTYTFQAYQTNVFVDDLGAIEIRFLDKDGTQIGVNASVFQAFAADGVWHAVAIAGSVPVGTRTFRLLLRAQQVAGVQANIAWDDITLDLDGGSGLVSVDVYQISAEVGRGYPGRNYDA